MRLLVVWKTIKNETLNYLTRYTYFFMWCGRRKIQLLNQERERDRDRLKSERNYREME